MQHYGHESRPAPYSHIQDVIEESLGLAHALGTTLAEVQMPQNDLSILDTRSAKP